MKPKILIVDDDQSVHGSFLLAFRNSEIENLAEIEFADCCEDALEKIKVDPFSYCLAFVDYQFKKKNQVHALGHLLAKEIKDINPCLTTVIMSGDESKEALKDWLSSGVDKFLYKPLSNEVIRAISENAIESYGVNLQEEQTHKFDSKEQKLVGLAGKSKNIKQVCNLAIKYAACDQPALILGETGTGKELVAKAIHENSKRRTGPFVVVNCAAFSKGLFESELFGHVKGAFTDAKEDKLGKFRQAHKGTIFLDEIHHLSVSQQASLLRAIQEKQILPVGGKNPIAVDFRLIVAGKPNLRALTESGEFLPDLYFRIKHLDLVILPLRERPEDILPSIAYAQNKLERDSKIYKKIMKPALDKLTGYNWPGNVRELIGEIERLYVVTDKSIIRECDLPKHILEQNTFSYYKSNVDELISLEDLDQMQKNQQIALIITAMKMTNYNITKAGILLGVTRTTLSSKLKALGLKGKKGTVLEMILNNLLRGKKEPNYESKTTYNPVNASNV